MNTPILQIPAAQIIVPPEALRDKSSKVDDDVLAKSIRAGGIQQPLVVIADGDMFRLVRGSRRLAIASSLGIPKVPVVVASVPDGMAPDVFVRRLRFILHEHQQDLLPSQRAELIVKLREMMGLSNAALAQFLGVDADSITNWLAVRKYVPEIVTAMDAGAVTMKAARVFDGMSETGQRSIWKKHRREICTESGGELHQVMRRSYPPEQFPSFYRDPAKMTARLNQKKQKRAGKSRADYTATEKKRLLSDVQFGEAEIAALKDEQSELKADIEAATPVVGAILRNRKLRALVPAEMLPELDRFAEVYV